MNVNVLINQKWNELLVPSNFHLIWCLKIKTKASNLKEEAVNKNENDSAVYWHANLAAIFGDFIKIKISCTILMTHL